jgi:hypothetical protein
VSGFELAASAIVAAFVLGILTGLFALIALSATRDHRAATRPHRTDWPGPDESREPDDSGWTPPRWPERRG